MSPADLRDPLPLAQALIRRRSVTPADDGAMALIEEAGATLGMSGFRRKIEDVENLWLETGPGRPLLAFAGHVDVVPTGDPAAWSVDPFAGAVVGDRLVGRGAADMKGAIAAFIAALARVGAPKAGAVALLLTGDEEGPGRCGTKAFLPDLAAHGRTPDHCLVGEPASADRVGDQVKNGRRGSLNAHIVVRGKQGHAAYPEAAANPVGPLLDLLARLRHQPLDNGAPGFQPSNLEVTTLDVGNPTHNVIPAAASARLNIRFNTAHKGADLWAWLQAQATEVAAARGVAIEVTGGVSGEAFLTTPGPFTDLLLAAATAETGRPAALSTSGGTSDARFIKDVCPVAELGLRNATAHHVDEQIPLADLETLTRLYARIITDYFARFSAG
jgi:succinyl-diaminopimelate desuccinylase